MNNQGIASILEEVADLLDIKGANQFKIRAYRNAAEILNDTYEQLRAIPNIGKDLATKIREIADTGSFAYLYELLKQFPATLLELLKLPGLGPKTVNQLHGILGIRTVDQLEATANAGQLHDLPRLGAKNESLLLRAIAQRLDQT